MFLCGNLIIRRSRGNGGLSRVRIIFVLLTVFAAAGLNCSQTWAETWPGDRWSSLADKDPAAYSALLTRPVCSNDFVPFATAHAAEPDGFKTDGLVVVRKGRIVYEYYDGIYDRWTPHPLWSASKSVTATVLGAAIQRGARIDGKERLSLDTLLHRVYPISLRKDVDTKSGDAAYRRITVRDLVRMTAGFAWEESYESAVEDSTVLRMLYIDGRRNMPLFAIRQPMRPEGPGQRWSYSGGNSNLIMGVLKAAYGPRYESLPWDILFRQLGISPKPPRKRGPVVERDASGHFVGSSYVYMTPRDMARLGHLYLRDGVWQGKRILPDDWVTKARTFNAAQGNLAFGSEYVSYINREGLFSERTFWLNVEVPGLAVQFPNAPRDMFFAAGHYGQLILILPTQDMVIARTGHDAEYWSKIGSFVSKAIACFSGD